MDTISITHAPELLGGCKGSGSDGERFSSVETLVEEIQYIVANHKDGALKQPLLDVMNRFSPDMEELKPYCMFDAHKSYTRNLIASDNERFTLMVLCWNKKKFSPIHDHPCDGCWFRVLQGFVEEERYNEVEGKLCLAEKRELKEGEVGYIDDFMGFHKVGNSRDQDAITLHIYSPAFDRCRVWFNEDDVNTFSKPVITYYSQYGEKIEY